MSAVNFVDRGAAYSASVVSVTTTVYRPGTTGDNSNEPFDDVWVSASVPDKETTAAGIEIGK